MILYIHGQTEQRHSESIVAKPQRYHTVTPVRTKCFSEILKINSERLVKPIFHFCRPARSIGKSRNRYNPIYGTAVEISIYGTQLLNACRGPGRPMQPPRTATMSNRKGSRDDDEGKVASNKASTTTIKSKKGSGAATRCQKNNGRCDNAYNHRGKCNNKLKGISSSDDDEGKVASKKASTTIKSKKDSGAAKRCQKNDGVCSNAHKHRGKCNNKHKERGRGRPINNPATSAAPPPKKRGRGPDPDAQPPPPKRPRVRTGAGQGSGAQPPPPKRPRVRTGAGQGSGGGMLAPARPLQPPPPSASSQASGASRAAGKTKGKRQGVSLKYKGVFWHAVKKKWVVAYHEGGKRVYVGVFDDELAAARAYDSDILHRGLNITLNFKYSAEEKAEAKAKGASRAADKTKGRKKFQGAGVNGEHDDRDTIRAVFNRSGHQQQQDFHKSRTSDGVAHWVLNKSLRLVSNENSRIDWAMKSKIASLFDDALCEGGVGKGPEAEFGRRLKQLLHGVSKEDKDEDILGIGQDIVAAYDGIVG
jgi:hypothetical protein